MRTPDLEFITLNDFDEIQDSDFFRTQEMLVGKSIMEICIIHTDAILHALSNYDPENENLQGSIIQLICKDDQVRKDNFKELDIYPK